MNLFKNSAVWQFAAGFALGALGLVALHPGEANAYPAAPMVATAR